MKQVINSSAEKYFRKYLTMGPLSLALWRSVEAKHLSRIPLKRPILDIGCGFGEFAEAFVQEPLDMGIDISKEDIEIARKGGKYKKLIHADAEKLPFKENSFQTVISISSLEHMYHPDRVFKEAYRVLKPGGTFVVTMETDEVDTATVYRPFFKKIGLGIVSNFCTDRYNKLFHRVSVLKKVEWKRKIKKAGFEIIMSKDIISPRVTKLFDIFLLTAWPSQIYRTLSGKRVVHRPKIASDLLTKIFLRYVDEEEKEGTNLLMIVRKNK